MHPQIYVTDRTSVIPVCGVDMNLQFKYEYAWQYHIQSYPTSALLREALLMRQSSYDEVWEPVALP